MSTIAAKARVDRKTASDAVARLVADGFLEILVDHRQDKAGRPSRYAARFPDDWPTVFSPRRVGSQTPPQSGGGGVSDPRGVGSETPGGVGSETPLTQKGNPNKNPSKTTPAATLPLDDTVTVLTTGDTARALTKRVYDTRRPKPVANFVGTFKLVERLLIAGHEESAIESALMEVPTFTLGWIEGKLNERRRPSAQVNAQDETIRVIRRMKGMQ